MMHVAHCKWNQLVGVGYFIAFIDDYCSCVAIYFIKNKMEIPEKFKLFEAMVNKECDEPIMKLRTDNGVSTCPEISCCKRN